jgi:hypothetical protein
VRVPAKAAEHVLAAFQAHGDVDYAELDSPPAPSAPRTTLTSSPVRSGISAKSKLLRLGTSARVQPA